MKPSAMKVVSAIRIQTRSGLHLVEVDAAKDVLRGLATHKTMMMSREKGLVEHTDATWCVTHIASGFAVIKDLYAEDDARDAMRLLAERVDWTQPVPSLQPGADSAKEEVVARFDTGELREKRHNIAAELGIDVRGSSLPSTVAALTHFEVRVLHSLIRHRNDAADIAEGMPESTQRVFGNRLTREVIRILEGLQRQGLVESKEGRPVTWRLKTIEAQS